MMDGIVLSMESIDFGYVDSIKACETDFDDIFVSCCSMKWDEMCWNSFGIRDFMYDYFMCFI